MRAKRSKLETSLFIRENQRENSVDPLLGQDKTQRLVSGNYPCKGEPIQLDQTMGLFMLKDVAKNSTEKPGN